MKLCQRRSVIACGTGAIMCLLIPQGGTTAAAGQARCTAASVLYTHPVAHKGKANELIGGIYWVGGPRSASSCSGAMHRTTGIVTVRTNDTHSVVAEVTSIVDRGYHIRLRPGSYVVESSACDLSGPVSVTARKHEVVTLDFVCDAP
jgi:hypothetical protein